MLDMRVLRRNDLSLDQTDTSCNSKRTAIRSFKVLSLMRSPPFLWPLVRATPTAARTNCSRPLVEAPLSL